MARNSNIKLTIEFNAPDLDIEERDKEASNLLGQLSGLDEVVQVDRVLDPSPLQDNKAVGGFLAGILMAEINPANAKKLIGFLGDRLSGKTVEIEVEGNGKKLKVKASSQIELMSAIEAAQKFIES